MLAKALYLLLMPSAFVLLVALCLRRPLPVVWRYWLWVVWLACSILVGLLVFEVDRNFDLTQALVTSLAVLLWSMFAVVVVAGGPMRLWKSLQEERRSKATAPTAKPD
jgi:hypothetical protein